MHAALSKSWTFLVNGLLLLLLIGAFITYKNQLLVVLPVLAIIAWCYIVWAVARAFGRRKDHVDVRSPPERKSPTAATITGTINAPAPNGSIDPDEMMRYLSSRVIGQSVVSDQLAKGIYRRMAQHRRGKPVFTALLSGPTGTGKTELAKAVADYLYGDRQSLFRIDCANVLGEAGLQTLIGSPKGFAGSSSWGALTSHLRSTPRSVILFDEIEKAVPTPTAPMAKLLLSLLDEGICTEQSDGTAVSATDAVILLTSNAAHEKLGALAERFANDRDQLTRATKDALRETFAPEFLARIDLVTTLASLDNEGRAKIVALHIRSIGETYGVDIKEVDASFVNEAVHRWTAMEGYGTREMIRWIEQSTADQLIAAKSGDSPVRVSWRDGQTEVVPI